MPSVYLYVVARDFGFAPNPFHGYCTLATCKPGIRSTAVVGDWVIGMGGCRLQATGRCLFAMQVTEKISFDQYWNDPVYYEKKPVRNGSKKMLVGDNIYCRNPDSTHWEQVDSHHSKDDGTADPHNVARDTSSNNVLISNRFFYFGRNAPIVPPAILEEIGYKNVRSHRRIDHGTAKPVIDWLFAECGASLNMLAGAPFDFDRCAHRYSVADDRIR
jgi:Nucleotide modification associated domain 2